MTLVISGQRSGSFAGLAKYAKGDVRGPTARSGDLTITHAANSTCDICQGLLPKNVALKIVLNTDSAAASDSSFGMVILK
jgi:hypothetical protein